MNKLNSFLVSKSKDRIEYMRLAVFLFLCVVGLLLFSLHIVFADRQEWYMTVCYAFIAFVDVVSLAVWATGLLPLFRIFSVGAVLVQASFSVSIVLATLGYCPDGDQSIVVNEMICYVLTILLMLALMNRTTFVMTAINIAGLAVAYLSTLTTHSLWILVLFGSIQLLTASFGSLQRRLINETRHEADDFSSTLDKVLHFFNMSKAELLSLLRIASNRTPGDITDKHLLDELSEKTQKNLLRVADLIHMQRLDRCSDLRQVFPMLSDTELSVCRSVVEGKTLKEIASDMGKSISNISTVRGNIRKKLGLSQEQDLKTELRKAIK